MINQDQLKALRNRIDAIGEYLKISEKRMQLSEEELKDELSARGVDVIQFPTKQLMINKALSL